MAVDELSSARPAKTDALRPESCTRKIHHKDELGALKQVAQMRAKGRKGVLRVYRCNSCRGYHVTSRRRTWGGKQWYVGWA
jgi:hypothetical protein